MKSPLSYHRCENSTSLNRLESGKIRLLFGCYLLSQSVFDVRRPSSRFSLALQYSGEEIISLDANTTRIYLDWQSSAGVRRNADFRSSLLAPLLHRWMGAHLGLLRNFRIKLLEQHDIGIVMIPTR